MPIVWQCAHSNICQKTPGTTKKTPCTHFINSSLTGIYLKIKNTSRPRPNQTHWTKPIQIKWNCKLDIGLGKYCPVSLLPALGRRPSIYN